VAQYSFSPSSAFKAYVNYHGGKPKTDAKVHQFDLVVTSNLTSKFGIGFNGTISSSKTRNNGKYGDASSWWGSAFYLNVDPVSWFGLTLRSELFEDKKLITSVFQNPADGGNVFATTLSTNFKVANLTIIPELRWDKSNKEIFTNSNGDGIKSTTTALLAAVYKF
jgi:hypothetical protein